MRRMWHVLAGASVLSLFGCEDTADPLPGGRLDVQTAAEWAPDSTAHPLVIVNSAGPDTIRFVFRYIPPWLSITSTTGGAPVVRPRLDTFVVLRHAPLEFAARVIDSLFAPEAVEDSVVLESNLRSYTRTRVRLVVPRVARLSIETVPIDFGDSAESVELRIRNVGNVEATWTATPTGALVPSQRQDTLARGDSALLTLRVSRASLPLGPFSGAVTVRGSFDGAPDTVVTILASGTNPAVWSMPTADRSVPRARHVGVIDPASSDGALYVFGGVSPTAPATNDLWALTPKSDSPPTAVWKPLVAAGSPRFDHTAVFWGGRLIVIGGTSANADQVLAFDPVFSGWDSTLPRVPNGSSLNRVAAAVLGGSIWVFNGTDTFYRLDPGATSWAIVTVQPIPLGKIEDFARVAVPEDSVIFISGGVRSDVVGAESWVYVISLAELRAASVPWRTRARMLSARQGHGMLYDQARRRLVVFGGTNAGVRPDDVIVFEIDRDCWWQMPTRGGQPGRPAGRQNHVWAYDPINRRAVLHGGEITAGAPESDLWFLDLRLASPANACALVPPR